MDCDKGDGKNESEKVEPVAVVPVCWAPTNLKLFGVDFSPVIGPTAFGFEAKDDATLEISVAPGFNALLWKEKLLEVSTCFCGICC